MFFVHKLVNWQWIKSVGRQFSSRKLTVKTRIMFLLDIVLLFMVVIITRQRHPHLPQYFPRRQSLQPIPTGMLCIRRLPMPR